ncbi:MAG TPA: hypothetical protein VKA46_21945 [Gemmataceae bacterium]|nr:hypothetical protein [Gemmataceae bacterium]
MATTERRWLSGLGRLLTLRVCGGAAALAWPRFGRSRTPEETADRFFRP